MDIDNLLGDLISDDDEEIVEYLSTNFFNRRVETRQDHFTSMRDNDFHRRFRLQKPVVLHLLEKIKHKLEYHYYNNRYLYTLVEVTSYLQPTECIQ